MIQRNSSGKYYCDGRGCGYPLAWFKLDPKEDGAEGEWVCLDCNDAMYASAPAKPNSITSDNHLKSREA